LSEAQFRRGRIKADLAFGACEQMAFKRVGRNVRWRLRAILDGRTRLEMAYRQDEWLWRWLSAVSSLPEGSPNQTCQTKLCIR